MKTTLLGLIVIITGATCASLGIGVSGIDISAYPPITPQNAHQLQQIKYFDAHEGVANAVSISADGMLVATGGMEEFGRSGGVRLWDLARGSQQAMTTYHYPVTRVAISPTQSIVAFGSYDGRIQLWNYEDANAVTSTLNNSDDVVTSLAFSPDGQKQIVGQLNSDLENVNVLAKGYLNGTNTGTVTVWDMNTHAVIDVYSVAATAIAISQHGSHIAVGTNMGTIEIIDLATDNTVSIGPAAKLVTGMALNSTGQLVVASYDDHVVRLWDTATGTLVATLDVRDQIQAEFLTGDPTQLNVRMFDVAFNPDDEVIVGGSGAYNFSGGSNYIWLWNAGQHTEIANYEISQGRESGSPGAALDVEFSPDGKIIAAVDGGGMLGIWAVVEGE